MMRKISLPVGKFLQFRLTQCPERWMSSSAASVPQARPDRLYEKVEIELRAHQPDVLKSYSWFATTAAKELDVTISQSIAEPEPHMVRKTLLKSAFVHSKHRVQYEFRTYYHYFELSKLTESTMKTYLEYIQRNLPEAVAMKVTKHERKPFPDLIQKAILEDSTPQAVVESDVDKNLMNSGNDDKNKPIE